ncbi:hypothetical protein [Thiohalobacter thiocyanaticus]|uniref:hypothetical protein n=1 Tax=Thiohalobacter thiocyanaticus TaxID=585455 RepID=UPI000F643E3B|nr:hypothetical protein [Thiohalobacter thiocyanaticus]
MSKRLWSWLMKTAIDSAGRHCIHLYHGDGNRVSGGGKLLTNAHKQGDAINVLTMHLVVWFGIKILPGFCRGMDVKKTDTHHPFRHKWKPCAWQWRFKG